MENINVFTGPMKSGKSSNIISKANSLIDKGEKVQVFKPSIDDRFGTDVVMDRNGNKISAVNISKIEEIANYEADSYFIDEFQFLNGDLSVIEKMAQKGKKFYIAGLNLTTDKKVFGRMGDLIKVSNNVKVLTARCDCCGKDNAIYSFCSINKNGKILIGDDIYMAVCSNCYDKLSNQDK